MFFTEIKGSTKAFKPAIIFGSNAILYAMVLFCINWLLYKKKIYKKL